MLLVTVQGHRITSFAEYQKVQQIAQLAQIYRMTAHFRVDEQHILETVVALNDIIVHCQTRHNEWAKNEVLRVLTGTALRVSPSLNARAGLSRQNQDESGRGVHAQHPSFSEGDGKRLPVGHSSTLLWPIRRDCVCLQLAPQTSNLASCLAQLAYLL